MAPVKCYRWACSRSERSGRTNSRRVIPRGIAPRCWGASPSMLFVVPGHLPARCYPDVARSDLRKLSRQPLEFGKGRVGGVLAAFPCRLEVAVELAARVDHQVILSSGVSAAAALRIEAHAHHVTVAVADRLERRLRDRGLADSGRVVEVGAQIRHQFGSVVGGIDVAGRPGGPALLRRQFVEGLAAGRERQHEQKDRPAHRHLPERARILPAAGAGDNSSRSPFTRLTGAGGQCDSNGLSYLWRKRKCRSRPPPPKPRSSIAAP